MIKVEQKYLKTQNKHAFIKRILLWSILCICFISIHKAAAQEITQTVRGTVYDQTTNTTLPGASVRIVTTDPIKGAATDQQGAFRIEKVPVGRHTIEIGFLGYETRIVRNVMVSSGQEVVLNIGLSQSVVEGEAAEVVAQQQSIDMVSISARKFSAEETRRYAGGLDDPSRMASSFAGVSGGSIHENALIVRGNSPKGLLWSLEGVEISNPTHFAGSTIAGGGYTTIFSNTVLANSDFLTGAFPAEYGNTVAGVFDMNFRNGNNQTPQYTLEAGTMGLNAGAEGPFSKDGNSSYLFNYRYSTMALATKILIDDSRTPEYQDLSFKLNLPTRKAGTFSLWGIGGLGSVDQEAEMDSTEWEFGQDHANYDHNFVTAASGLSHKLILGEKSFLSSTLFATINSFEMHSDSLNSNMDFLRNEEISNRDLKLGFQTALTHRFSPFLTTQTGIVANQLFYDITTHLFNKEQSLLEEYLDEQGNTTHLQAYTQLEMSFSDRISATAGVHVQYLDLNENYSIEPRVDFNWTLSSTQSVGLAYGLHSQLEPTKIYFTHYRDPESGVLNSNRALDFTKAHHLVFSYKQKLSRNMWLTLEPYIQQLYDVPVVPNSNFSFINYNQIWHFDDQLINEGKGRNIGVDLTLERQFSNNYYLVFTSSLFDATYETAEGETFDSRYNKNYVFNLLGGKEFVLGDSRNRLLGLNARFTLNGGTRTVPVLQAESRERQEVVLDWSRPFEDQRPAEFIADLSVTYRINKQNHASEWALQVKNMLGVPSFVEQRYNYIDERVEPYEVSIIMPSISYRIEF